MVYLSKGPKETEKLAGFLLAPHLKTESKNIARGSQFLSAGLKSNRKKALVIALEGELGAGKTVFVRGVTKALKIKAKIKSPTFTLAKKYKLPVTNYQLPITSLYHFDCYRLRDHRDLKILGIQEILNNPENLVLVEWSDRVKKILPKNHIKIHIDHIDKNTRKIKITS